jgi:hypothetical protein
LRAKNWKSGIVADMPILCEKSFPGGDQAVAPGQNVVKNAR